ncbi:hypothetical protein HAX54_000758 [Datura stramonium]|uniref:Uncharacterized protein n=1 Tax=Datura stramonium TaxID=4076 RepID=A0ABS8WSM4_DATST|nr:hypothetical protein [Datura stramonium]
MIKSSPCTLFLQPLGPSSSMSSRVVVAICMVATQIVLYHSMDQVHFTMDLELEKSLAHMIYKVARNQFLELVYQRWEPYPDLVEQVYQYHYENQGSRSASETMGDKLHRREGKRSRIHLRAPNDRSVIKESRVQEQPRRFA